MNHPLFPSYPPTEPLMRFEPNVQRGKKGTGPETDKSQPQFLGCFVGSTEQRLTHLVSKVKRGTAQRITNFLANQGEHSHDVAQGSV